MCGCSAEKLAGAVFARFFSSNHSTAHICVCYRWVARGGGGMGGTEEVHKSAELEYLVPNKWDLTC